MEKNMAAYLDFWQISQPVFIKNIEDSFLSDKLKNQISQIENTLHIPGSMIFLAEKEGYDSSVAGKHLFFKLPSESFDCIYIPLLREIKNEDWILQAIAESIAPKLPQNHLKAQENIANYLDELNDENKTLVIILDGIELFAEQCLIGLQKINMFQQTTNSCINFVLLGNQNAVEMVRSLPDIAKKLQFYKNTPFLSLEDCHLLIDHYLSQSPLTVEIFDKECIEYIHSVSKGSPSIVENICENVLIYLAEINQIFATPDTIKACIENYNEFIETEEIKSKKENIEIQLPPARKILKNQKKKTVEMTPSEKNGNKETSSGNTQKKNTENLKKIDKGINLDSDLISFTEKVENILEAEDTESDIQESQDDFANLFYKKSS